MFIFAYSAIITLIHFSSRVVSNDCNSKSTSRGEFMFFSFKTIEVVIYTFMYHNTENVNLLYIIIIILSNFTMF